MRKKKEKERWVRERGMGERRRKKRRRPSKHDYCERKIEVERKVGLRRRRVRRFSVTPGLKSCRFGLDSAGSISSLRSKLLIFLFI